MILHFGDWHGEPPLVSQVYSERVLTSRVPLLLRGSWGGPQGSNSTSSEFPKGSKRRWSGFGAKRPFTCGGGTVTIAKWVDRLGEGERLAVHSGEAATSMLRRRLRSALGARRSPRFHPVRAERGAIHKVALLRRPRHEAVVGRRFLRPGLIPCFWFWIPCSSKYFPC